jgi:hypothetical protein
MAAASVSPGQQIPQTVDQTSTVCSEISCTVNRVSQCGDFTQHHGSPLTPGKSQIVYACWVAPRSKLAVI